MNTNQTKLIECFFSQTRYSLLSLFFSRPEELLYVNQILKTLNCGTGTVQRELKMLTESGILTRKKLGNLVLYSLNRQNPIFEELKSIIHKTSPAPAQSPETFISNRIQISEKDLRNFCERHHINKLSLFGSVLRDDFRPDSDIDILVEFEPGHVPGFGIISLEKELSTILGRRVDIRTSADLSRYFRNKVVKEARTAYEHTQL
jgi:predicted nucleotidyltransferase/predicted transcriptional regulator